LISKYKKHTVSLLETNPLLAAILKNTNIGFEKSLNLKIPSEETSRIFESILIF